jgi:sec-independent protein translocase protein TatC
MANTSAAIPDATPVDREHELEEGRMAFSGHLQELRTRLRNSVIALAIGFALTLKFSEDVYVILAQPLIDAWKAEAATNSALGELSLFSGTLIDPFWTYFSLAFWTGIFVSSPFIFYQVWKFIAPGLYKKERRWGLVFSVVSALLFCGGAYFCYQVVLPAVCKFLLGYYTESLGSAMSSDVALNPLLTQRAYLDFAKKLLVGFGLIFELPMIILVLSIMGMVTHRSLWKFNRWAILLSFVVAAALTPPEIYSQIMMAGPMVVLYNLSIVLSFFVTWMRERKQKELDKTLR